MSQAVFAEFLGVSAIPVQGWERGVRTPSPLACRLLDIISKDSPPGSRAFDRPSSPPHAGVGRVTCFPEDGAEVLAARYPLYPKLPVL